MRRVFTLTLAAVLVVSLSGCLGTLVHSPARKSKHYSTTRAHLLGAPTQIDAHACANGLAETVTYAPLWGVAVGILTIGIIVPMTTNYSCVPAPTS